MRLAVAAALFLALGIPAGAMMPPEVYQEARQMATNIVVVTVESVDPAAGGIGECTVHGTVERVEHGDLYAVGQTVQIYVPCFDPESGADLPIGGTIYQDTKSLTESKRGKAWLGDLGQVMESQYEQLE